MNTHRRKLLIGSIKGGLGLALASVLSPALLSSCKKKTTLSSNEMNSACPNGDLSDNDKMLRASLNYVDKSSLSDRTCDNCKLYTQPTSGSCGGCKVVPGPIHPKGYCTAWLHRM